MEKDSEYMNFISYSQEIWFNIPGDLDDFIFFENNDKIVSEK